MTGEVVLLNDSGTAIPISKNQFLCAYIDAAEAQVTVDRHAYRCIVTRSNKDLGISLLQFADPNMKQRNWYRFSDDCPPTKLCWVSECHRLSAPISGVYEHFYMGTERHVLHEKGHVAGAVLDKKGKLTGVCVPSGNADSHYVPIFLIKSYIGKR